jgi:GNAT superfamily N-acetyltransferase
MMKQGDPLWEQVIVFASQCPWMGGPSLAKRMRNNGFADWERVCAAVMDDRVVGFSLFCEKGGMPAEYDYTPFIASVFVDENYRGRRISQQMIECIMKYAKEIGYQTVYLKSAHRGLYEKYGFEKIADFTPVIGPADQLFKIDI